MTSLRELIEFRINCERLFKSTDRDTNDICMGILHNQVDNLDQLFELYAVYRSQFNMHDIMKLGSPRVQDKNLLLCEFRDRAKEIVEGVRKDRVLVLSTPHGRKPDLYESYQAVGVRAFTGRQSTKVTTHPGPDGEEFMEALGSALTEAYASEFDSEEVEDEQE